MLYTDMLCSWAIWEAYRGTTGVGFLSAELNLRFRFMDSGLVWSTGTQFGRFLTAWLSEQGYIHP